MSEDDEEDWFESAVGDEEREEPAQRPEEPDAESEESPLEGGDDESPFAEREGSSGDTDGSPFGEGEGESPFDEDETESPFGEGENESPFGEDQAEAPSPFEGDDGETSPFEGDSETTPLESDDGGTSPFDEPSGESPFGESEEGGLFDDDFADAFESAGGPGGEAGGGFDEAEFESEIPRIDLGIEGLDRMILGGIPERHLIVTIGSAGTGKTTFGLQFLHHGLQQGDNAVFITLEQSREAIVDTAGERGWEFARHEEEGSLAIVDLDPVEMANSLDNIRAELPRLVEGFDADRLVLDSVSLLEMMYDDQAKRRTEVFDFTRSLKQAGVTTMLTSEASESNPYASRHGIIEYLTDAVFVLQYVRSETRETRLAVEIQKIRNANHSRETKPYEITGEGISVYQQANIF